MASIHRNIATIGRLSSIGQHAQLHRWLHIASALRSTSTIHESRPLPTGSSTWQYTITAQTRHATSNLRSRDCKTGGLICPSSRAPVFRGGRRWLSTSIGRQFAQAKDDSQRPTSTPTKTETTPTPTTTSSSDTSTNNIIYSNDTSSQPSILKTASPIKLPTPPAILHENIYTLPNLLTTTRIITAPWISYALLHSQPILAFTLFAYSSITDLVDGYLARHYNSSTVLGSILDPFADKLLMTLTTITLFYIGTFPWWLALTILGRDAGLLLSALYFRWISLPPPRTMTRYWDFSLPSAEVRPTEISKINTLLQFLLVASAVGLPVLPVGIVEAWNLQGVLEGWMGLVAATTVWSGLSYVFSRDAIRFIGRDRDGKMVEKMEE